MTEIRHRPAWMELPPADAYPTQTTMIFRGKHYYNIRFLGIQTWVPRVEPGLANLHILDRYPVDRQLDLATNQPLDFIAALYKVLDHMRYQEDMCKVPSLKYPLNIMALYLIGRVVVTSDRHDIRRDYATAMIELRRFERVHRRSYRAYPSSVICKRQLLTHI